MLYNIMNCMVIKFIIILVFFSSKLAVKVKVQTKPKESSLTLLWVVIKNLGWSHWKRTC